MYGNHGLQRYKETDLGSMSPEKIIVMLYEKVVSDLRLAGRAIAAGDRIEMSSKVNHSLRIVTELRTALNHDQGGEIATNLEAIYDFLFHEHLQLLVDQDSAHVENCIKVIEPLLSAWRQVSSTTDSSNRPQESPEVHRPGSGADPATYEAPQPGESQDPQGSDPGQLETPYQRMVSLPA